MNLIRWESTDPLESFTHIQREMSDLIDFLSSTPKIEGYVGAEFPQVVVSINKNSVIVRAEIPGIKVNDLDVQVSEDILSIKGERKPNVSDETVTYLRRERNFGTFARSVMLPEKVDAEKVAASYKNGVLTITLPKAAEKKPKQITIQKS
ncbi:MAG: Hsp20/alpha crystallin family protein [Candidatus Kuenenia sp.]|nr:Hsp20/alpha crystallin family protein [Candidatus Kuenenia hertensis]